MEREILTEEQMESLEEKFHPKCTENNSDYLEEMREFLETEDGLWYFPEDNPDSNEGEEWTICIECHRVYPVGEQVREMHFINNTEGPYCRNCSKAVIRKK
jgi:hypothetical protein